MSHRLPFGAPVKPCAPTRPPGPADVFVLGVYPSALHVRWKAPDGVRIANLAVDNEPSVFWTGDDADALVAAWRDQWFDPAWGEVSPAPNNGSSGVRVDDDVLTPLSLDRARVWFTDAVNEYFLKVDGPQGKALDVRFTGFADAARLPAGRPPDLAPRPSVRGLVQLSLAEHRDRLQAEIEEAQAPRVITLGNEALLVLGGLAESHDLPTRLSRDASYGQTRSATVVGRRLEVIPLKHAGQHGALWRSAHNDWAVSQAAVG